MNFLKNSSMKIWMTTVIGVGIFIYLAFFVTSLFISPMPEKKLTIATGRDSGTYYKTALKYQEILAKEKVEVKIITTAGSVDALKLLNEKKVDIAFVQGGTVSQNDKKNLLSLASLYYEPLWVFYDNSQGKVEYLKEFQGKKISIGEVGSGSIKLSNCFLKVNNINKKNSNIVNLTDTQAVKQLQNGEIDALMVVTSAKSQMIKELLENPNISLLSFKRAVAYEKQYKYISPITLFEGVIDLKANVPQADVTLLATTASLAVRGDLPEELVRILMKELKVIHSEKSFFQKSDEFPTKEYLELPLHPEAKRYLQYGETWLEKIFPFWIASNIDRLKILIIPFLTLLVPLSKGFLPLYRWSIRHKIYKWYDLLNDLDRRLPSLSKDEIKMEIKTFQEFQLEITDNTKIPLSYMGEYYNLKIHIDFILDKMERLSQ